MLSIILFACTKKESNNEHYRQVEDATREINEKFAKLDSSLKEYTEESKEKSTRILKEIEEKVKYRGNKQEKIKALEQAKEMHKLSQETIMYIESLKAKMDTTTVDKKDGEKLDSAMTKFILISQEIEENINNSKE